MQRLPKNLHSRRRGSILAFVLCLVVALCGLIASLSQRFSDSYYLITHRQAMITAKTAARDIAEYGALQVEKYAPLLVATSFLPPTGSFTSGNDLLGRTSQSTIISVSPRSITGELWIGPVRGLYDCNIGCTNMLTAAAYQALVAANCNYCSLDGQYGNCTCSHVLIIAKATLTDKIGRQTSAYACKVVDVFRRPASHYTFLANGDINLYYQNTASIPMGLVHTNGSLVHYSDTFYDNVSANGTISWTTGNSSAYTYAGGWTTLASGSNISALHRTGTRIWDSTCVHEIDGNDFSFGVKMAAYAGGTEYLIPRKTYPSRYKKMLEGLWYGTTSGTDPLNPRVLVSSTYFDAASLFDTSAFQYLSADAQAEMNYRALYAGNLTFWVGFAPIDVVARTSNFSAAAKANQGCLKDATHSYMLEGSQNSDGIPENSAASPTNNDIWFGRYYARKMYPGDDTVLSMNWGATPWSATGVSASSTYYPCGPYNNGVFSGTDGSGTTISCKRIYGPSVYLNRATSAAGGGSTDNYVAFPTCTQDTAGTALTTPNVFWDENRQSWVYVIDIDCNYVTSHFVDYTGFSYANNLAAMYFHLPTSDSQPEQAYGIRLKNANTLAAPLIIATNGAMYIEGEFNINSPKDAVLAADNITFLTPDWKDEWSRSAHRPTTATGPTNYKIYATLIAGRPTGAYNTTDYMIRLLEVGNNTSGVANNVTGTPSGRYFSTWLYGSMIMPFDTAEMLAPQHTLQPYYPKFGYYVGPLGISGIIKTIGMYYVRETAELPTCDITSDAYANLLTLISNSAYWDQDDVGTEASGATYHTALYNALKAAKYPIMSN